MQRAVRRHDIKTAGGVKSRPSFLCHFLALLITAVALAPVPPAGAESLADLRAEHGQLLRRLTQRQPRTPYIVIDSQSNRLQVRSPLGGVVRDAVCSTGAGRKFEGQKHRYRWQFATPKGRFSVLRKVADPIWVKPVWQFLEAGEEVPVFAEDRRRFQPGILGEYALYFAKDYMIHGTLYEINLGRNMTHGCVRVGSADLRYLYEQADVGWPVYVY